MHEPIDRAKTNGRAKKLREAAIDERAALTQQFAEDEVDRFRQELGPYVVAAENTRMPMVFTDARVPSNPITFVNDAFLNLTGHSRDEVLSQTLDLILTDDSDAEGLERVRRALKHGSNAELELECRRKDGSKFFAALYLCPVHDANGAVVQNFLSLVEITSHVERALKEHNALNALYQHAPGFIAAVEGREHRFTYANAAYEKLVGSSGLRGKKVVDALPEIAGQGFLNTLDHVYATGLRYVGRSVPIMLRASDGSDGEERHYLDFIYQPISDGLGNVSGIFCEGYDVTEQKLANDQVLFLQNELIHLARVHTMGTMATTLAHELTQPLTAIANFSAAARQLIGNGAANADPLTVYMDGIAEGSQRAVEIIRHLRDMTNRGKPKRRFFDLHDAVGDCVRLVQAGQTGAAIVYDDQTAAGLIIAANRVQIQQVILNLVRNASEAVAGSDRRVITISATVDDEQACVRVTDTGPGISSESAPQLFEWSTSSKVDGMGIGLAISRTIIEAHDGRIWLDDSSEGGASFAFSLPVVDDGVD